MASNVDFPSFNRVPGSAATRILLLCDHASNALPESYGGLGLPPAELGRHIAYDIGARDLVLGLAQRLGAPAVLSCFSRLLIDPNRGPDDPTLIMKLSDGAVVPGNRHVTDAERRQRIERFHRPYHQAVEAEIAAIEARGLIPLVISIHSFTPRWKGVARPWHVGILWDWDETTARALIDAFAAQPGLVVGDNQPYHGALAGDTMDTHCNSRGIPHALIEIRQDLIATKSGVDDWVDRVALALEPILNTPPHEDT